MVAMIERDQKQKMNNNRNYSAINGYSPYRASMASRNDGRPPTRPITPIKSAQAARYPHQNTASNTSQITNSMIGHQDESNFSQNMPNLGLQKQQASAPFGANASQPPAPATEENE
jgi:hypothetical protein